MTNARRFAEGRKTQIVEPEAVSAINVRVGTRDTSPIISTPLSREQVELEAAMYREFHRHDGIPPQDRPRLLRV